jgi:hypothetical protein
LDNKATQVANPELHITQHLLPASYVTAESLEMLWLYPREALRLMKNQNHLQ